jgi:predicted Zn-dependent protease
LDNNPNSLASGFIMIKLLTHVEKYQSELGGVKFKKKAKDQAQLIKKADEYFGYLAWAEIYVSTKDKREVAIQVLEDLTRDYPNKPQAYLRLWDIYNVTGNKSKSYDIAEKLFLYGTGYSSIEIR